MHWRTKSFYDLTNHELYAILQLRTKVFVVEQNCVFQDMDGKDQEALHVMGYDNSSLVAYSRLLPAGVSYKEMSIGRVITDPARRRKGLGKELMQHSIDEMYEAFGEQPIHIGAQKHLTAFYEGFGFNIKGEEYLEDGIPHVEMLRM